MGNLASCIKVSLIRSLWHSQMNRISSSSPPPLILVGGNLLRPPGLACLTPSSLGTEQSESTSSSSSSSSTHRPDEENAPSPFQDLPEEVMDRIRSCLPLSAYVRASAVSKQWRQDTFSRRLLLLCSEMHPPEPWLFALCIEPCSDIPLSYVLDSEYTRWRKVKMGGFSSGLMPRDRGCYPVASSRGLLCVNAYSESQVLLVLNPLMSSFRELPKRHVNRPDPVVGLFVDEQTCSFKVIAIGSFESEAITEVYDSLTNEWSITTKLPLHQKLAFACSLFSRGSFYCWTAGPPEALLVYDMQKGSWSEIPMLVPSCYAYGRLVEHEDKILLVGVTHGVEAFKSIRIWELCEPGVEMLEIARMPYGIFRGFCGKGKGPLVDQIVSSGNLLYLYSKRNPKLVVCNLRTKPPQWHQLTPSGPLGMDKSKIYLFSFCVHARLLSSIWNNL